MKRRDFLLGLGSFLGTVTLSGCVTPPVPMVSGLLPNGLPAFGGNPFRTGARLGSGRDDEASGRAMEIFEAGLANAKEFRVLSPAEAKMEVRKLRKLLGSKFRRVDWFSRSQVRSLAETVVPTLVRADKVFAIREHGGNGVFPLYPNETVKMRFRGFCMDHNLPAPRHSPVRLFPLDRYYPEEKARIFTDLGRFAAKEGGTESLQGLVWALQAAVNGINANDVLHLSPRQMAMLREASPEAERIIAAERSKQQIFSLVSKVASSVLPVNLNGLTASLNPANDESVRRLLSLLMEATPKDAEKALSGTPYTMLSPEGVVAKARALTRLQVDAQVFNASASPFLFNAYHYVAEAPTSTQRVLPGIVESSSFNPGELKAVHETYGSFTDWFGDWLGKSFEKARNFLFVDGPHVRLFAQEQAREVLSDTFKLLIEELTPVGRFTGVVEALTGYEWTGFADLDNLEDHRLSSAERILAAASILPGVRAIGKCVGGIDDFAKIAQVIGKAAEKAGTGLDVAQIGQEIRDMMKDRPGDWNSPKVVSLSDSLAPEIEKAIQEAVTI
jgi:hypothetical protein